MKCTTSRKESGKERISSTKLTHAARVTATRNYGYWNPKKALQIQAPIKKIIPPPRSTILEWELRSLGLSMMLKWLAMLKYTNSASSNRMAIATYTKTSVILDD